MGCKLSTDNYGDKETPMWTYNKNWCNKLHKKDKSQHSWLLQHITYYNKITKEYLRLATAKVATNSGSMGISNADKKNEGTKALLNSPSDFFLMYVTA